MLDRYRKRLAADLDRWIAAGLVPAQSREAILADVRTAAPSWTAAGALAILGSTLLALAVISFVAANWAVMAPGVRFAAILAALWAALAGAGICFRRGSPVFGHALAVLGAVLFGGAIVLTAQTFNISSFYNTGLLLWAVGALAVAAAAASRPALILAALIGSGWVWLESLNPNAMDPLWGYAPLWAVTAFFAARMRSAVAFNLLGAGLALWIGFETWNLTEQARLSPLQAGALFTLALAAAGLAAGAMRERGAFGAGIVANWSATIALAAGFALQFGLRDHERLADRLADGAGGLERIVATSDPVFAALAGLFLLVALGAVGLGIAGRRFTPPVAAAIVAALVFVALLPWIAGLAVQGGPGAALALRIGAGTILFALAIALILGGSREGRRFIGGLGIVLFAAQTLYIYGETFGGLLDTAFFFLVGGLILFALSFGLLRVRKRLAASKGEPS